MADPATDFQDGFDMTVERSIDGGTVWAAIPRVKSFSTPEVDQASRDVTDLDSPTGWTESRKGLKTLGSSEILCNYTRAGYAAAETEAALADPVMFRITAANGDVFAWPGNVTISPSFDLEGETVFTYKIKGSGALTWTAGV
jgi:hypothetical protein